MNKNFCMNFAMKISSMVALLFTVVKYASFIFTHHVLDHLLFRSNILVTSTPSSFNKGLLYGHIAITDVSVGANTSSVLGMRREPCRLRSTFVQCCERPVMENLDCSSLMNIHYLPSPGERSFLPRLRDAEGVSCQGCEMQISEEAYGCSECNFFLHEACAKAPLEAQHHPFHPKHPLYLSYDSSCEGECHACGSPDHMGPIRYRCEECELIFDLSCVISTMPREDDDDDGEREDISRRPLVIDHFLHPHQLSSYHSKTQTKIKCRICTHQISSENFFGCLDCSFFLHGSCAQPPVDAIQHYLHPEHTLTFAQCPYGKEHKCAVCGSLVGLYSYCYTCQMCDLLIHSFCASATLSDLEKGVAMTAQYPFHKHELKLYCNVNLDICIVCSGNICINTLAYRCFSKRCEFKLHKSCLQLSSHLVHPSHSLHALTLCFSSPNEDIVCRRCNKRIIGTFAFSCGECNFYLHVGCAKKETLKHPFHEHHLFYFESEIKMYGIAEGRKNNRKCTACHKSCGIDFFWCRQCDYTLHYECSQLPLTIKSEHHCYCEPLVLRKSFIEDERAEYYCDICEGRRDPKKWVYFCETCDYNFVAHVECALSPISRFSKFPFLLLWNLSHLLN